MAAPSLRAEQLGRHHRREGFSCGVETLDRYLKQQASQDARRNLAAVYVLVDVATEDIAGYYTLSSFGLDLTSLPDDVARRAGRYPRVPAILIGRLARALAYRGQSIGELLLFDALRRSWLLSLQIGAWAVVVDAKDEHARRFYERFGFIPTVDDPERLFLPLDTVKSALRLHFTEEELAEMIRQSSTGSPGS